MDASSLRCPQCGAAADSEARRCRYCQARLATISCPSCFALMFDTSAYCPKCGTRRARAAVEAAAAQCPGCGSEMQRIELDKESLLECGKCDGVWIEADAFERLCGDRAAQAAVLHHFPERRAVKAGRVRYRRCLACGTMMNRVNFGKMSGTIVDVCRGHGTFLDAGELHDIVQFIHGGGLDRSRERQIQELKEQERRLESARMKAAFDRGAATPEASVGLGSRTLSAGAIVELLSALGGRVKR